MIVVCPGCSAKFRVADEKVGPRGAKLRCSKCQTVFSVGRHIEQQPAAPAPPSPDPVPEVPPTPPRVGPPPLPRRTTLDARAAFEVDLEPHHGAAPAPADPFAPAAGPASEDPFGAVSAARHPAPPEPSFDPFAAHAASPPPSDPFGGLGSEPFAQPMAPALAEEPSTYQDFDPFAPAAEAPARPEEGAEPPLPAPAEPPFAAGRGGSGQLSLEELTTPPVRRLAPAQPPEAAPMALLAATEDPFGASAPLDRGLSELDDGVVATAAPVAGPLKRTPAPRSDSVDEVPIQLDPFAAAAVAADPLAVDEPSRSSQAVAPPAEPPAEGAPADRAIHLKGVLVSAMALAALLLLSLAILVVWRGGLSPADAFRPSAIVAALAPRPPSGLLSTRGVTSGLYDRARGRPLLFVRGLVVSNATAPLEGVRVVVEVVRDGAVVVRGEVPAGAVPGPEALHDAVDAAALAEALADAGPAGAAPLAPGGTVPFLAAFADYPADLAGASLRVHPLAGTAR